LNEKKNTFILDERKIQQCVIKNFKINYQF